MSTPLLMRAVMASFISLAVISLGCDGQSVSGPTRPILPSLAGTGPPGTMVIGAPSISSISPTVGSTGGGTPLRITGSNLGAGTTVAIDGVIVPGQYAWHPTDAAITFMLVDTPAHAAGAVDVVVTNVGVASATLTRGYTYAPPQSFDFNGEWYGNDRPPGEYLLFKFTIRENRLVSLSCNTYPGSRTWTLSPAPPVSDGEFSYTGDGLAIAGRIVEPSKAIGTLDIAPCGPAAVWEAGPATQ